MYHTDPFKPPNSCNAFAPDRHAIENAVGPVPVDRSPNENEEPVTP